MSEPHALLAALSVGLGGFSFLPLALTGLNALTWRRPRVPAGVPRKEVGASGGRAAPRVSVLIPARNEAARLPGLLESLRAQGDVVAEVVVYSDQSTDGTDELVEEFSRRDPRVRLLRGAELPSGWVGKPHACQRLWESFQGDVAVFVDADVRLKPGALEALIAYLSREFSTDPATWPLITGVPEQRTGSLLERLIVPLLHVTYTSWLPLRLAERSRDPRKVAANGQLMVLSREVGDDLDGFSWVSDEIVDDVALARWARRCGVRVVFLDAHELAFCRMYQNASDVWQGFSKNLFEGLGSVSALSLALSLYLGAFVAPYLLLIWALQTPGAASARALPWALAGVLANLGIRLILSVRHGHPLSSVVAHPVAVLLVSGLAISSAIQAFRGKVVWRGRKYVDKAGRASRVAQDLSPGQDSGSQTPAGVRPLWRKPA